MLDIASDRSEKSTSERKSNWVGRRVQKMKSRTDRRRFQREVEGQYKELLRKDSFIRSYESWIDEQYFDSEEIMGTVADIVVSFNQVTKVFENGEKVLESSE